MQPARAEAEWADAVEHRCDGLPEIGTIASWPWGVWELPDKAG
jgi:hypothetical protein